MVDVVITHVDVLQGNTILKDSAIVVENGYIKEFVTNDTVPQAKEVIDGKGMLAAPGLINTHTHIAMGLLRNYADDLELMDWLQTAIWPAEAKLNNHLVYWGTQLGIAEMFRSGTTCLVICISLWIKRLKLLKKQVFVPFYLVVWLALRLRQNKR